MVEQAVAAGDKGALKSFCSNKAQGCDDDVEKEVWTFLGVLFEDDARRQLLSHLEFEVRLLHCNFVNARPLLI